MTDRAKLHQLIDSLPETEIPAALRLLQSRHGTLSASFLEQLASAPFDDEPETDEEREAVAKAQAEVERGETIPYAEAMRRLGHA